MGPGSPFGPGDPGSPEAPVKRKDVSGLVDLVFTNCFMDCFVNIPGRPSSPGKPPSPFPPFNPGGPSLPGKPGVPGPPGGPGGPRGPISPVIKENGYMLIPMFLCLKIELCNC